MTAATISAPAVHKAWLSVRADVAHDALTDHINACNPCWSAVHMPGHRYLCPVGDDLTSAYDVAAAVDQDAEAGVTP